MFAIALIFTAIIAQPSACHPAKGLATDVQHIRNTRDIESQQACADYFNCTRYSSNQTKCSIYQQFLHCLSLDNGRCPEISNKTRENAPAKVAMVCACQNFTACYEDSKKELHNFSPSKMDYCRMYQMRERCYKENPTCSEVTPKGKQQISRAILYTCN